MAVCSIGLTMERSRDPNKIYRRVGLEKENEGRNITIIIIKSSNKREVEIRTIELDSPRHKECNY